MLGTTFLEPALRKSFTSPMIEEVRRLGQGRLEGWADGQVAKRADAPVRACHRYLSNPLDHLDYQGALAQGLPIGSGEIESAHRWVVQQRLKRPGAWSTPDNAGAMLAPRLTRASGQWSAYRQQALKQAA